MTNKDRNFARASLARFIRDADERGLADYVRRLDEADAGRNPGLAAARGYTEHLHREDCGPTGLLAIEHRALLADLERSGESQVSLTDPDSRAMAGHTQGRGRLQCADRRRRQAQADRRAGR